MKKLLIIMIATIVLGSQLGTVSAAEETVRRRPDNPEFVTETQIRLTTQSLSVQEVTASHSSSAQPGLLARIWQFVRQSMLDFSQNIKQLFN